MAYTISLVYGSVRQERQGIKAAKYLFNKLEARGHNVHFIDPLDYQLPLLDKMYKEFESGDAPINIKKLAGYFEQSDAFVIVSGEYNHSMPPALKNILDHFQQEYLFKPSAIACYSAGSFGGVRAAVHLRTVLAELGMPSISSLLPFPVVQDNFDEDGNALNEKIHKRANRFLDELEWYTEALKKQREKGTPF